MKLENALLEFLHNDEGQRGWTRLDLQLLIEALFRAGEWKGEPLNIRSSRPSSQYFSRIIRKLLDERRIEDHVRNSKLYTLPYVSLSEAEKASISMPQGYISYLAAMEHYGLTDRFAKRTTIIQPSSDALSLELLTLHYRNKFRRIVDIGDLIAKYEVHMQKLRPKGVDCQVIKTSKVETRIFKATQLPRYVSIGRLFIDMVEKPDYCSGMDHVIDVYLENAPEHYPRIMKALSEGSFSKLTRVKVGFILAELCNIRNDDVLGLKACKQRGGSSKLVPSLPFESKYIAEEWDLSLNMERPEFDRFRY